MAKLSETLSRESMEYDVVIVGAGPAGLACALRLAELAGENSRQLSIAVLEKGAEPGAHILSGALVETAALERLVPDWQEKGEPLCAQDRLAREELVYLSARRSFRLPSFLLPPAMRSHDCHIASLGRLVQWLAAEAEGRGVEIYCGFPAIEPVFDDDGGRLAGLLTADQGLNEKGLPGPDFMPGVLLKARLVILAEGARGHLSRRIIKHFTLAEGRPAPRYALGLKELWRVGEERHERGTARHYWGWPLGSEGVGGGFVYHYGERLVGLGMVVHASYANPALPPFGLLQRFKTHPAIARQLAGGERLGYGARLIALGSAKSRPLACFPGGALTGDCLGLFDRVRLKGIGHALDAGRMAGEAAWRGLAGDDPRPSMQPYEEALGQSHIARALEQGDEMAAHMGRFGQNMGGGLGLLSLWSRHFTGHPLPHPALSAGADRESFKKSAFNIKKASKPDGRLVFDLASSLAMAGVSHDEGGPSHISLRNSFSLAGHIERLGAEPCLYFCPAGVFEQWQDEQGRDFIHIAHSNCLHCRMCSIKEPGNGIIWRPPASGGPHYASM